MPALILKCHIFDYCYHDFVFQQWTTTAALAPHNNPIGHLQELVAKKGLQKPEFDVTNGEGPPHQRTFETTVTVGSLLCTGKGRSKKEAKRKAAEAMLNTISKTNLSMEPPNKKMAFVPAGSTPPAPISFLPAGNLWRSVVRQSHVKVKASQGNHNF